MSSRKKGEIEAELAKIASRYSGRVTPQAVVAAAKKNKSGPLGRTFTWTLQRAAEKHWLDHARDLIARYVTITVVHRAEHVVCPMYVRDPSALTSEQGYVSLTSASLERNAAMSIVVAEIDRCHNAINRGRAVSAVLDAKFPGLSEEFELMLARLVDLRERLKRAA